MLIIMMLLFLSIDVDLNIAIFAPATECHYIMQTSVVQDSLVCLFSSWNIKLVKGENNSLKILAVLHSIDEVATHDVGLEGNECLILFSFPCPLLYSPDTEMDSWD